MYNYKTVQYFISQWNDKSTEFLQTHNRTRKKHYGREYKETGFGKGAELTLEENQ